MSFMLMGGVYKWISLKSCRPAKSGWAPRAVALLKKLVSCDTTDYNENNGQAVVKEYLAKLDCVVNIVRPDAGKLAGKYASSTRGTPMKTGLRRSRFQGSGRGRSVILNSHMDTVFPAAPEKWLTGPFDPVERTERYTGWARAIQKAAWPRCSPRWGCSRSSACASGRCDI